MTAEFVELSFKRNRGWPWPDESWGLSPMYGEDGWCHSCGTPLREQRGPLTLRRRDLTPTGAWMPNWNFDTFCLEGDLADDLASRFRLTLREVAWRAPSRSRAMQVVIPTVGPDWFDPDELRRQAVAIHGTAGTRCPECATWRWFPLPSASLPPVLVNPSWEDFDVIASPEWFGDGMRSFRETLMRRDLAEAIAAASPRDFKIPA